MRRCLSVVEFTDDALHEVLGVGGTGSLWSEVLDDENSAFVAEYAAACRLFSHLTKLQPSGGKLVKCIAAWLQRVLSAYSRRARLQQSMTGYS